MILVGTLYYTIQYVSLGSIGIDFVINYNILISNTYIFQIYKINYYHYFIIPSYISYNYINNNILHCIENIVLIFIYFVLGMHFNFI